MSTPMHRFRSATRAAALALGVCAGLTAPAWAQEHSRHPMPAQTPPAGKQHDHATMDHARAPAGGQQHDHAAMDHGQAAPGALREPIPVLTDADRAAAFPDVAAGHTVHDSAIHQLLQLSRLEGWEADEGAAFSWEGRYWRGTDLNRLWLRSEGEHVDGRTEAADLEALYGRAVAPWWDLLVGVRQDFRPGPSRTFAAIGVQGVAP